MILDTVTKTLELVLGTAQTTTAMPITVDYVDMNTTTTVSGSLDFSSNGTTLVTIGPAPAASTQRKFNLITVYNADSVSKEVTIRLNNNTALRPIVVVSLSVGDMLSYTDTVGWKVTDTYGAIHTVATADVGAAIAAAPSKTTPIGADKIGIWDSVSGLLNGVLFSNLNLLWANIAGSASQVFSVAPATAAVHAVPLSQTVGRDKFINGAYQVSQEFGDTAATITAGAAINYTIDRWYTQCTGQNITAQRVAGTAPFSYAYKLIAGATGPTTTLHGQRIEGKGVAYLENGDVAVQVRIKGDVARVVTWKAYYANAEDVFSTKTEIATGTINATTAETMYQFTFAAGANAKNGIAIEYTTGALTNGTGFIQYTGHQFEAGTVAKAYEHISYVDMLDRCLRFREHVPGMIIRNEAASTQATYITWIFSVKKRAVPTITLTGTQIFQQADTGSAVLRESLGTLVVMIVFENTAIAEAEL